MNMKKTTTQVDEHLYFNVAEGVWGLRDIFVNVYMIENSVDNSWVLVDAGLKTTYPKIKSMAARLFGENSRPSAIIVTHGHFDHVGSLKKLAEEWDVPVYAHYLEMPYLTGRSAYPPADSSVGGGLISFLADLYPAGPLNLGSRVQVFPDIMPTIPVLPEWKYIHTPGHSPGHISLWREKDKVLIVGDAFVTTKQESVFSVIFQRKIVSGPPKYFTCNWLQAEDSVSRLAGLLPNVVATGHGMPMAGLEIQQQLIEFAYYFREKAVPEMGRYTMSPAITDGTGVVSVPPEHSNAYQVFLSISTVAALGALGWALLSRQRMQKSLR
jgi:glyoxylase-like metal-dependent hydrolase (beta-lactamase superfamily II)